MSDTTKLGLTEMEEGQSQKHVTFNEALKVLDTLVQISIIDRDVSTPPSSPSDGDQYIVSNSPSGDWTGATNQIATYQDGVWVLFAPKPGFKAFIIDEGLSVVFNGTSWAADGASVFTAGPVTTLAESPSGASTSMHVVEEELTGLSGASVTTTIAFPNQCIIQGVSTRTTTAITGATSYDVGDGLTVDRFGGLLNIALGSTNQGLIGPTGNYANTTITLTANGGSFTGGAVKVALHYTATTPPQS